ncbi:MAG: hypothetical protein ABFS18_13875 [Thermodesulfobacteriota bacterium]
MRIGEKRTNGSHPGADERIWLYQELVERISFIPRTSSRIKRTIVEMIVCGLPNI